MRQMTMKAANATRLGVEWIELGGERLEAKSDRRRIVTRKSKDQQRRCREPRSARELGGDAGVIDSRAGKMGAGL
jgi:hypothetical protein